MKQNENSTKIHLIIEKNELIIISDDGLIHLKGKLTKEKYYLFVHLCRGTTVKILKFTTTSMEQKLKTIDNLLI